MSLLSGQFNILFQRNTTRDRVTSTMALTELAGISIFLALSFQSLVTLGESVLTSETDKEPELKVSDKRTNNFRVPVETPFDPNFWPARGRRGQKLRGGSPERDFALRCPTPRFQDEEPTRWRWPLTDGDTSALGKSEYGSLIGCNRMGSNCFEEQKTSKKVADFLDSEVFFNPKRSEEMRNKKQRRFGLPRIILYGNGLYWEHENPYAEKKKKQDVFWVARGKKNFFRQQ